MKEEKSTTTHIHIWLSSNCYGSEGARLYRKQEIWDTGLFKTLLNEPIIPMIVMETVNQEVNPTLVEDTWAYDEEEATTMYL